MKTLAEFYNDEVPEYIHSAGKSFIVMKVTDFQVSKKLKVTIKDIIRYYKIEAGNITSGCRTLAGYTGDWRPIDYMAKECLEYFKYVNIDTLRREAIKAGMTPKF